MALVVTPVSAVDNGKEMVCEGTIVASGNYATGGDTLDLTPFAAGVSGRNFGIASPPKYVIACNGFAGYVYQVKIGTALNNSLMKVLQSAGSAAPLAEIAASAYPGGVTGDTITIVLVFKKLQ